MAQGRIAVVGAGLAGLSAAVELKRLGYAVDLFERSRLLGGKATSFEVDGIEVDNGQHVFLACCREFINFVEGLGGAQAGKESQVFDSALFLQPRFEALLLARGRRPVRLKAVNLPAPLHLSRALLQSSQLGLPGRFQVALALMLLRGGVLPGESFGTWLRRHGQGKDSLAGFWDPFLVPALNAPMDEVSAEDAAFVIRTAFLDDPQAARFGYARVPLGRIANRVTPLVDRVRLRTPVVGLEADSRDPGRSPRTVRITLNNGDSHDYGGVVLAVTPERLKSILARPKNLGVFGLDQFKYAPIVDIHLWYDLTPGTVMGREFGFGALLRSPIQWVFEKPAPPGETYLCCSMSAASHYVGRGSRDLVDLAHSELTGVLPWLKDVVLLRGAATRDREATFIPSVGLIRPGPRTASPRVVLAGAWTDTGWPATMESAVRSGRKAVEVLHGAIAA